MKPNADLTRALAQRAKNYRDSVPVFQLQRIPLAEMEEEAARRAQLFIRGDSADARRFPTLRKRARTVFHLPEGARLSVFHASGVLAARRGMSVFQDRISDVADGVDRDALERQGREAVKALQLDRGAPNEKLEFERLWLIKASGMTESGQRGMTSVLRAVAAFRRVLDGLPVLGRASVFVRLAAAAKVDAWGRDWRPVHDKVMARSSVLEPGDAALAIVRELQTRLPEDTFTLDDLEPASLDLGYLALGKRRPQSIMQPVWVAQLLPRGPMGVAHLITVAAAPAAYEPICRLLRLPPGDVPRRRAVSGVVAPRQSNAV